MSIDFGMAARCTFRGRCPPKVMTTNDARLVWVRRPQFKRKFLDDEGNFVSTSLLYLMGKRKANDSTQFTRGHQNK
jgi:hypothetical protein